jgi:hypothetical protein
MGRHERRRSEASARRVNKTKHAGSKKGYRKGCFGKKTKK